MSLTDRAERFNALAYTKYGEPVDTGYEDDYGEFSQQSSERKKGEVQHPDQTFANIILLER